MERSFGKILLIALLLIVLVVMCICFSTTTDSARYLRIHIRANSNAVADQDIKYVVKEAVVEALAPLLANVDSKQDALHLVKETTNRVRQVAEAALCDASFDYSVNVKICREEFPARSYGGHTLTAGVYDALIIELGAAQGDNWWCVVYPPLCFVGYPSQGDFCYVSKLEEIIRRFYANNR